MCSFQASDNEQLWVLRVSIVVVATLSCIIAIEVKTVYGLWYLCSDFVYVLLFPQLLLVLYYKRGNTYGALIGYAVGAFLRFTGGEPLLNLDPVFEYPHYDEESGYQLFPFKTFSMLVSLATTVVFSELAILVDRCISSKSGQNPLDIFRQFDRVSSYDLKGDHEMNGFNSENKADLSFENTGFDHKG